MQVSGNQDQYNINSTFEKKKIVGSIPTFTDPRRWNRNCHTVRHVTEDGTYSILIWFVFSFIFICVTPFYFFDGWYWDIF